MKHNFFKTTGGKILLFFICIISLSTAVLSGLTMAVMFKNGFYTASFDDAVVRMLESQLLDEGYNAVSECTPYYPQESTSFTDDSRTNVLFELFTEGPNGEKIRAAASSSLSEESIENPILTRVFAGAAEGDCTDVWQADNGALSENKNEGVVIYTYVCALKEGLPVADTVRITYKATEFLYQHRAAVPVICAVSLILVLVSFIILMCVAGRNNKSDEPVGSMFEKVPADLFLAIVAAMCGLMWIAMTEIFSDSDIIGIVGMAVLTVFCVAAAILTAMDVCARFKHGTLLSGTLTWKIIKLLGRIVKLFFRAIFSVPSVWHTLLTLGIICIIELFLGILWGADDAVAVFALDKIITYPAILYMAHCMKKLRNGSRALADGNLAAKTDTRGMYGEFLRHGNDLNSISDGMSAAVSERMKSERMKTELITNVSHDIKTPLTSVINYADLICKEETENPKIREYSEVLLRQSERLKKLLTDLIDASKAASGALEFTPSPCDAAVFLEQAAGEYEDRFVSAGLTPLITVPDAPITVTADGRHMQRIFDNLMGNIIKYSLSGTRVYLSVEKKEKYAAFVFRNTSREPLNTSADELTARFVRGDASRSSEGSGLGLSIAKSLAELQGGRLEIITDGDLFKAIVYVPLA